MLILPNVSGVLFAVAECQIVTEECKYTSHSEVKKLQFI